MVIFWIIHINQAQDNKDKWVKRVEGEFASGLCLQFLCSAPSKSLFASESVFQQYSIHVLLSISSMLLASHIVRRLRNSYNVKNHLIGTRARCFLMFWFSHFSLGAPGSEAAGSGFRRTKDVFLVCLDPEVRPRTKLSPKPTLNLLFHAFLIFNTTC